MRHIVEELMRPIRTLDGLIKQPPIINRKAAELLVRQAQLLEDKLPKVDEVDLESQAILAYNEVMNREYYENFT